MFLQMPKLAVVEVFLCLEQVACSVFLDLCYERERAPKQ